MSRKWGVSAGQRFVCEVKRVAESSQIIRNERSAAHQPTEDPHGDYDRLTVWRKFPFSCNPQSVKRKQPSQYCRGIFSRYAKTHEETGGKPFRTDSVNGNSFLAATLEKKIEGER